MSEHILLKFSINVDHSLGENRLQFFLILCKKSHKLINTYVCLQSALAVALLNVYIPAMLGVIVNILASMKHNPNIDFIEEIKLPALKMISLYIGQVSSFF